MEQYFLIFCFCALAISSIDAQVDFEKLIKHVDENQKPTHWLHYIRADAVVEPISDREWKQYLINLNRDNQLYKPDQDWRHYWLVFLKDGSYEEHERLVSEHGFRLIVKRECCYEIVFDLPDNTNKQAIMNKNEIMNLILSLEEKLKKHPAVDALFPITESLIKSFGGEEDFKCFESFQDEDEKSADEDKRRVNESERRIDEDENSPDEFVLKLKDDNFDEATRLVKAQYFNSITRAYSFGYPTEYYLVKAEYYNITETELRRLANSWAVELRKHPSVQIFHRAKIFYENFKVFFNIKS